MDAKRQAGLDHCNLTTEQATAWLGAVRASECYAPPSRHPGADRAIAMLRQAEKHGRARAWKPAAEALQKAYNALGASPPELDDPRQLWHRGEHPIQLAGRSVSGG